MQVSKWGNSLAIRLPAAVVEELKLKAGDEVNIRVSALNRFTVERRLTREEAIRILRKGGYELPKDYKFDREEANARPGLSRH